MFSFYYYYYYKHNDDDVARTLKNEQNDVVAAAVTTAVTTNLNDLEKYDKIFDNFNEKYVSGVYAYDLPCQHWNSKKIELQCRSADELATTKFYCFDCETFIE